MKKINLYKMSIALLMGVMVFGFTLDVEAQQRARKRSPRKAVVVKLPVGHKRIVVGKSTYYFHSGIFYRKSDRSYTVIKAPVGARVHTLPAGYKKIIRGGVTFYSYYGTYYRYLPSDKIYVVVEAPVTETVESDIVVLIDGRTLEGVYVGGRENQIHFEVDGEIQTLDVSEIVSLSFSPPAIQ